MSSADRTRRVRAGAAGGSGNEAGSGFRAGAAAYIAAHILRGQPFADLGLSDAGAVPKSMSLETNEAVDDLVVGLSGGGSAYIQAKTELTFGSGSASSMKAAVTQWTTLAAETSLDPTGDRLVAAAARGSGSVRHLRDALRRRRRELAGPFSGAEKDALARLAKLLGSLEPDLQTAVLDCAVVWLADLEEVDGLAARLGQTLLEPGVVEPHAGGAAWRTLRETARDLARKRYGATLMDLIQSLLDARLVLTEDGRGYASAQQEDRRRLVRAYRRRVRGRGETLDLRGLGTPLPPIRLEEVDAGVRVLPGSTSEPNDDGEIPMGLDLLWALRRRGRALLLGLPGSGKSVALRAAAAGYAGRDAWPLPLVVPIDRLARLRQAMSFDDALLDAALQDEPPEDRSQLRVAAIEALRAGDAALFLDGLDETRSMRHRIVSSLSEKLGELDPAVEMLLSTRDVAYAEAHTLGFADLRVLAPEHPLQTARTILRTVASERGIAEPEVASWVEQRARWVEARIESERGLHETPLMVVLLTLLATRFEPPDLPTGRGPVLARVLEDVVNRWEAGQRLQGQRPRLGSLEGVDATRAAQMAFTSIGCHLNRAVDPTREDVLRNLAQELTEPFGLPSARATGVAEEALSLWDEAGVFTISGSTGRVQSRLRLFAELAEALRVAGLGAVEQRAWVREAVWDPDAHEPALLASSLSDVVADELVGVAAGEPGELPPLELVAEAARQGVRFSDPAIRRLLLTELSSADPSDEVRFQRAVLALDLDLPRDSVGSALDQFDQLPSPRRVALRAISVARWSRDDDAVGEDLRAVMDLDPLIRIDSLARDRVFVGRLYQEAVIAVANHMDEAGPAEVAPWLAHGLIPVSRSGPYQRSGASLSRTASPRWSTRRTTTSPA